eukprot:CAMPEP_0195111226 /NCGR_PEP_ID=MMETSP0448-20130528/95313_1 /TAXON_ID=66468 /ORGANISM="Heterocapsa triquestra, Strain CCMP 448" /LENGTH=93 /DNA_ID=CAMNT_0040147989 /DNA_START=21 /DNA_END=299 /DNA_ORIENTATION=+
MDGMMGPGGKRLADGFFGEVPLGGFGEPPAKKQAIGSDAAAGMMMMNQMMNASGNQAMFAQASDNQAMAMAQQGFQQPHAQAAQAQAQAQAQA